MNLKGIARLNRMYWLITFCCVTVYISAFPFFQVTSTVFLAKEFRFNTANANLITSLPNFVSAFTSPVLGLVVDKSGRRCFYMMLSTVMFIICYVAFIVWPQGNQEWSFAVVYVLMGCALCLFGCVMWPCIPLVTEEALVGTAFGLTTAVQNLGLATAPLAQEANNVRFWPSVENFRSVILKGLRQYFLTPFKKFILNCSCSTAFSPFSPS